MTEQEILEDKELWRIDSEDLSEDEMDDQDYNAKTRNKYYYETPASLENEETQMARYMVETAPGSTKQGDDWTRLSRQTK